MEGFVVVKDPAYRSKKYEGSMDPDVIRDRFASHKGAMTEQQKAYFGEISLVEQKAKEIVEEAGVPTFEVAQYINVARKCYSLSKKFSGATLTLEAQALVNHWASRGLNGLLLARVCNISGCGCSAGVPSETPLACSIGDLLVCGLDGWQAFSPGDSCKVLHSQGPGVLPDWVDHGGIGGLGDDDHTQYVLRSILTQHGDLFFRDGAGITRLAPGVDGRVLTTHGVGADPTWEIPAGGAPTKEFTKHFHLEVDWAVTDWPVSMPYQYWARTYFYVPHDFSSFDEIELKAWNEGTENDLTVRVEIYGGACGETKNVHPDSDSITDSWVANINKCWDLINDFSGLDWSVFNPGDYIMVRFNTDTDWSFNEPQLRVKYL